jgi:hypothetical protein
MNSSFKNDILNLIDVNLLRPSRQRSTISLTALQNGHEAVICNVLWHISYQQICIWQRITWMKFNILVWTFYNSAEYFIHTYKLQNAIQYLVSPSMEMVIYDRNILGFQEHLINIIQWIGYTQVVTVHLILYLTKIWRQCLLQEVCLYRRTLACIEFCRITPSFISEELDVPENIAQLLFEHLEMDGVLRPSRNKG